MKLSPGKINLSFAAVIFLLFATTATALAEPSAKTIDQVKRGVVSITTYVVVDFMACLPEVMGARDHALAGHRVASTLVTVPALARPAWKMEIAVVAAR